MRRFSSNAIHLGSRLLAASTIIGVGLSLTSCDNRKTTAALYQDPQECIKANVFSPQYCETNFKAAQAENTRLAPQYANDQDCQDDWDSSSCDQTIAHGHSVYTPHMSGYWVGYTETPGQNGSPPTRKGFSYPVYKAESGAVYSPETDQSFESFGRSTENPDFHTAGKVTTAPRLTFKAGQSFAHGEVGESVHAFSAPSRGGFGEAGRGFSGGHGFGSGE